MTPPLSLYLSPFSLNNGISMKQTRINVMDESKSETTRDEKSVLMSLIELWKKREKEISIRREKWWFMCENTKIIQKSRER